MKTILFIDIVSSLLLTIIVVVVFLSAAMGFPTFCCLSIFR